jgi:hypothetical protein
MDWKAIKRAVRNLLLLVLVTSLATFGQEAPTSEFDVEAACLYHFAEFVTWPSEAFAATNSPIVIGILGDDPLGAALEPTVRNKTFEGHPFQILRPDTKSLLEIKRCHILFICASERRRIPETLEALQHSPVLTVSRVDRFIQLGGMVHFLLEGKRVRFEIEDDRARKAGLRLSSKLLRLARPKEGS